MLWQIFTAKNNPIVIDRFAKLLIIKLLLNSFLACKLFLGLMHHLPIPRPICWYSSKVCDIVTTQTLWFIVIIHQTYTQYIHDSYTGYCTHSAQKIVFRYITEKLLHPGKYQQKSFITIIWEKSMDCMSIQMVPREETELHRKHSHSIIVSLEVWLAWDGRWMISWPEYIHIIHKQTTQNRISIKSNKEKEIKQLFLFFSLSKVVIFMSPTELFSRNLL